MNESTRIERCEDALRMLAAHLDGELSVQGHAEVERHLARCKSCYSRAQFERQLKAKLAEVSCAAPRPGLQSRIRSLIERFPVANPSSD